MEHARRVIIAIRALDEDADRDALLNVEHVLVRPAVRRALPLLAVAVEVEQPDLVECRHQRLTHAAERRVVEVAVVGDEAEHTLAGSLDAPLREADELHVVVVEPLWIALAQRLAIDREVATDGSPSTRPRIKSRIHLPLLAEWPE